MSKPHVNVGALGRKRSPALIGLIGMSAMLGVSIPLAHSAAPLPAQDCEEKKYYKQLAAEKRARKLAKYTQTPQALSLKAKREIESDQAPRTPMSTPAQVTAYDE